MVGLRGESNQRHRGSNYLFIHLPISTKYERLCAKPESIRYPQKVTCDNFGFNATSIMIELSKLGSQPPPSHLLEQALNLYGVQILPQESPEIE